MWHRHRRYGHRQKRAAAAEFSARHGVAWQIHRVCRRRSRPSGQTTDCTLPAGRGARCAQLVDRHQGAVGSACRQSATRAGGAYRWLASGAEQFGRRLFVSLRGQQGGAGLCDWPELQQPLAQPLWRNAALENAPGHTSPYRRWQAHWLWRARHAQRRFAGHAPTGVSGWCLGGVRSGHAQCRAHQGHTCRHQIGHAGSRRYCEGAGS